MPIQKITIRGEQESLTNISTPPEDLTDLKSSFVIGSDIRGITESHTIDLDKDDLLEFTFEDNTIWFSNADNLDELFPESINQNRSEEEVFVIPAYIQGEEEERGVFSRVAIKLLRVFGKKKLQVKVRDIAADLEMKLLANKIGLYQLGEGFVLGELKNELTNLPHLLFIHGTAASTEKSFKHLNNTEVWQDIKDTYQNRIIAFQYESLTQSLLYNTFKLVEQLPDNIELHIITQSGGGIIGDILSRFVQSDNEQSLGFDQNEIDILKRKDRKDDIEMIDKLRDILKTKRIIISKFIRVACPANGSLLASKRLDNFLNITFNLIGFSTGIGTNPFYLGFKNLILAVVESRNEPDVLPGVEVLSPNSIFTILMNGPGTQITLNNPIHVIAGNCKIKFNLKALLIIASKLFFRKANDLIVNTDSMYRGPKRAENLVQYYFDEGNEVDHFSYFENNNTQNAIKNALANNGNALAVDFRLRRELTEENIERQAWVGLEYGKLYTDNATGKRPIVVLVPGIMGSNLSKGEDELWIDYLGFLNGKLVSLAIENEGIESLSIVKTSYNKLKKYLSSTYDVITFPFDWRKDLTKTADEFNEKIIELIKINQPIKIIAHSMGGVLVRDFIINHNETWQWLNQSPKFKLLLLGAPLKGSFRIPAVLCGMDSIIDKLSRIDIRNSKKDLLHIFSKFPGLLNLLPLTTDNANDFSKTDTWKNLIEPLGKDWPIPQEKDLEEFKKYRDKVLDNLEKIDYSNVVYIAGKDKSTKCGYKIVEKYRGKELVFYSTGEGDQSVTWESGIPKKMIANDSVYYVNVTHGALANEPGIFQGISEILSKGFSYNLSKARPLVRSSEKIFRSPEYYDFDLTQEGVISTLLGLEAEETSFVSETPIRVSISNGDLRYAAYPIIAGHFKKDGLLYAEESIDNYLEGALSERHQLGVYPGDIGTSEIIIPTEQNFKGTIIVGLGEFGELTAFELTKTIEQGISKYLLGINRKLYNGSFLSQKSGSVGVSSLVIGCGYGGLAIEESVRAVIQGVQNANKNILKLLAEGAKLVEEIEFVEKYEDAALGCFYSLRKIENEEDRSNNILIDQRNIKFLFGSQKRLPTAASEGWWKRLTVQLKKQDETPDIIRCLLFSASTGGAREEQRELFSNTRTVEQLIENISKENQWTPSLAKSIYELLIPNDFKDKLQKQGHINWILDKFTASYPWELLQDNAKNSQPLCVNAGMIRQLTTQDFNLKINLVAKNNALVVGDPELNGFIFQLEGAYKEGELVTQLLKDNGYHTTTILNGSSFEITHALFGDDYKIIHLAGHGIFEDGKPEKSGMVIGDNEFLSIFEICQMSTVPELAFINCCHLGKIEGIKEKYYRNRYKLAANIGTQLVENGVKAVIAAGWAVNDAAALDFTKVFYESMFAGYNFGVAVQKARKAIFKKYKNTNTWGAYQCYGDPFYKFRNEWNTTQPYEPEFIIAEQAEIELNNLSNEIETGKYTDIDLLSRLTAIAKAVDMANIRNASITEKEAFIYADLCDYKSAIIKFEQLLEMEKANFTVTTLEEYCNIRTKQYVLDFFTLKPKPKNSIKLIDNVIKDLNSLLNISNTAERQSLLGSAFKRKAIVTPDKTKKKKAYTYAALYYRNANFSQKNTNSAYALTNWIELESILILASKRNGEDHIELDKNSVYDLPFSIEANHLLTDTLASLNTISNKMDYSNMAAKANLELCKGILNYSDVVVQDNWEEVLSNYRALWNIAGSKGKKIAEIEHLEILLDALILVEQGKADALIEKITNLKRELELMV